MSSHKNKFLDTAAQIGRLVFVKVPIGQTGVAIGLENQ